MKFWSTREMDVFLLVKELDLPWAARNSSFHSPVWGLYLLETNTTIVLLKLRMIDWVAPSFTTRTFTWGHPSVPVKANDNVDEITELSGLRIWEKLDQNQEVSCSRGQAGSWLVSTSGASMQILKSRTWNWKPRNCFYFIYLFCLYPTFVPSGDTERLITDPLEICTFVLIRSIESCWKLFSESF